MQQSGQFLLMTREEFKNWLFNTNFTRVVTIVQEHHTAIPGYKDFNGSNHFTMLNGMRNYHMTPKPNGAGFSDIAQNITIFPDGMIAICRSFEKSPAGILGVNTGALCIENVGYFDKGGDVMKEEQRQSIIFVAAVLCIKYKLTPNQNSLVYHHWFNLETGIRLDSGIPKAGVTKSCPGTNFFGGNTVAAFNANFLPLVVAKKAELLTPPPQITKIVEEVLGMFNDEANISLWAKEAVDKLEELNIVNGDNLGNFNPKDPISREAMAVVIVNVLKYLGKV